MKMFLLFITVFSQLALAEQVSPGFEGTLPDGQIDQEEAPPNHMVDVNEDIDQDEFLKNWNKKNQVRPDVMQILLSSSLQVKVGTGQTLAEYLSERMAHPKDKLSRETNFANYCKIPVANKALECTLYVSSSADLVPGPQDKKYIRVIYEQSFLTYHIVVDGNGRYVVQEKMIPIFSYSR